MGKRSSQTYNQPAGALGGHPAVPARRLLLVSEDVLHQQLASTQPRLGTALLHLGGRRRAHLLHGLSGLLLITLILASGRRLLGWLQPVHGTHQFAVVHRRLHVKGGHRVPAVARLDLLRVAAARKAEEAVDAPVLAPGVADLPVLDAVLLAPAHDLDVVVHVHVAAGVVPDGAVVAPGEVVGAGDGAHNGPPVVDLGHHGRLVGGREVAHGAHVAVRRQLVHDGVADGPAPVLVRVLLVGHAVGARRDGGARLVALLRQPPRAVVVSPVGHAALVRQAVVLHVAHHVDHVAAVAAVTVAQLGRAVEEGLAAQHHVGRAPALCDLEAVADHGQSGVKVARATVLGDVLVPVGHQPVAAILVGPVKVLRQLFLQHHGCWLVVEVPVLIRNRLLKMLILSIAASQCRREHSCKCQQAHENRFVHDHC
mmetsp:Transcript_22620/g.57546  ORF Transcript_22620/g.57546 Transcript_22620/m.57546 type:complete len:425 (-) Transcript_22620:32-1306(-)